MLDYRPGHAPAPAPARHAFLPGTLVAVLAASALTVVALIGTRFFLFWTHFAAPDLDPVCFLCGPVGPRVPFDRASDLFFMHLNLSLFLLVDFFLALLAVLMPACCRNFPVPRPVQVQAERREAGPLADDPARLAGALPGGDPVLAAWVVDAPRWRQRSLEVPFGISLVVLLLLALTVAIPALGVAGILWLERYLLALALGVPLASLLVACLNPGLPGLVVGCALLGAAGPYQLGYLCGPAPAALGGDPLVLVAMSLVALGYLVLLFRATTRPVRFLVLGKGGFSLVDAGPEAAVRVAGPRRPTWLATPRGILGGRFRLGGDPGEPWDLEPIAGDPHQLRELAREAGLVLEHPGPGDPGTPRFRLEPRHLILPILAGAVWLAILPAVRLGMYLSLGVIAEIEPTMESLEGARRMLDVCDRTMARFPDEVTSRTFKAMLLDDLGEGLAARQVVGETLQLYERLRYPDLVAGEVRKMLAEIERHTASDPIPQPTGPAVGWEPAGPGLADFRFAAWRAFVKRPVPLLRKTRGTLDVLAAAARAEPVQVGPRVLLALHQVFEDGPEELGRLLGLDPPGPGETRDQELVRLARVKAAVRKLLEPVDGLPGWAGTSALLGSLMPGGIARARRLDALDPPPAGFDRATLAAALPELAGVRWCETLEVGAPPPGWRPFLMKPPAALAELVAAWPELGEAVPPGGESLAARLEAAARNPTPTTIDPLLAPRKESP